MKKSLIVLFIFLGTFYLLFFLNDEIPKNKIIIGQSASLSGSTQDIGIEFIKGANAYFNYVNDLGGINGREIINKKFPRI
jgi:ABC-type branched-subunit amino acid transport system substrate-binding protein